MSVPLIPVTIVPQKQVDECYIQLSEQLYKQLQIETELTLILGRSSIQVRVHTKPMLGNEIHMSEKIFIELSLPIKKYQFLTKYDSSSHSMKLGPIIGLLMEFSPTEKKPFSRLQQFCEELHQVVSEKGGFFYVFSCESYAQTGYYYEEGKWLSAKLPSPDVIYNRASRKLEQIPRFKKFRTGLEQQVIPLFNDRFFSKWEVNEWLREQPHLQNYLPETQILSKESFELFVQQYDTVFIKPIHGSQGRHITKIEKSTSNHYSFQTSIMNRTEQDLPFDQLYRKILSLLGKSVYIIQEGLSLVTIDSNPLDFRVLCHKNHEHQWVITSIVARVGAENEIVSNIARGGTTTKSLEVLRFCFGPKKALEALDMIKELSLRIAQITGLRSKGITGELGIDIGVDLNGKPWLIEVNSKPSKFNEEPTGKIRPSAKAIIRFCTILSFDYNC
ncbi:YheC/YheD family protein [Neobacillus sp. LXY-1]|uniref:YheC/YheD family endospore coat-associated protein n=1 Tax=Neobacillus sp. LXY-1 TaxID=3379133 RepID=UPI003EE295E6